MDTTIKPSAARNGTGSLWLKVYSWEMRRIVVGRLNWLVAGLSFLFFFAIAWGTREPRGTSINGGINPQNGFPITIGISYSSFSGLGILQHMPEAMLVLGFMLPLLATTLVSQDLLKRNHELYMATAVTSPAYVLGRFLAGMTAGVVLAVLIIPAYLAAYPFASASDARQLDLTGLLIIWAVVMLPAYIIITALAFALGTWWPRLANAAKAIVAVVWFGCFFTFTFVLPRIEGLQDLLKTLLPWDPTRAGMISHYESIYYAKIATIGVNTNNIEQKRPEVQAIMGSIPDFWPWLWPQLVLAALSLGLVMLIAVRYHRYRKYL